MKNIATLALLFLIGCTRICAERLYSGAGFFISIGDRFGDGWNGAQWSFLRLPYNVSHTVTDRDYRDISTEDLYTPATGTNGIQGTMYCAPDDVAYFALLGENNTLLANLDPPAQYWEIVWEVSVNNTRYHGGWNTKMAFTCDGNYTMLDWTENLLESVGSCPECQHPKPKPKPKPKGKDADKGKDDVGPIITRRLEGEDDKKEKQTKSKPKPPTKYWPVPVKLMDPLDQDGWFDADNMAYAEFTISDSSRMNLLGEGTLCAAKGSDGYQTVCETMLPDGHYIFRASGIMDRHSTNYTWQLCGKEAIKYEIGMSDPFVTGENATMLYDYRTATGHMGNEVSFEIKKGQCIVDETVVDLMDYANGTALDTVLTLEGHVLLEHVHFSELTAIESAFLEADINEFVNLEAEKTVTVTSVESVNDGTLVGFRVTASHAESQVMQGSMENIIQAASSNLQTHISGGSFLSFMKNSMQVAGMGDDKLMAVYAVQFVDLQFDNFVTLRNGKTMTGDIVAGGVHASQFSPIVSSDRLIAQASSSSSSALVFDILTASGAFALVAVMVALVVVALKPPAATVSTTAELDNSSANLVSADTSTAAAMDTSASELISKNAAASSDFSYQDSLSAALTQRWEMNSEDDSVRL
jgi:hypothetical protein